MNSPFLGLVYRGCKQHSLHSFPNTRLVGDLYPFAVQMAVIIGGNIEDAKARFDEYAGEYDSLADYAEELTEQSGETIPVRLAPYIDYKAMAHDYEQSGDFLTFRIGGSVHVFWAH